MIDDHMARARSYSTTNLDLNGPHTVNIYAFGVLITQFNNLTDRNVTILLNLLMKDGYIETGQYVVKNQIKE